MNALWLRFVRIAYRREPISSFILTIGVVDAVIGGVGERPSLLTFGIIVVLIAIAVRWLRNNNHQDIPSQERPKGYLPPQSSPTPLPLLTNNKQHRRS